MCEQLGIPLAIEKVAGPMTTHPFLGIVLDTIKMEARLLVEKSDRICETVAFWLPKSATKQAILNTSTCHQDCLTWKDLPMKNVIHSFQSAAIALLYSTWEGLSLRP